MNFAEGPHEFRYHAVTGPSDIRRVLARYGDTQPALFFCTLDDRNISADHVNDFIDDYLAAWDDTRRSIINPNLIVAWAINDSGTPLTCAACGSRIPATGGSIE